jgi:diguanylate cyclase (GGDEF)-like protein
MLLDVRTAVLLAMLIAATLSAYLFLSIGNYPDPLRRHLAAWARALGLQALGWGLFGLRGRVDDLLSIPLANLLLTLAFVETLRALRGFAGRPEKHVLDVVAVVFSTAVAAFFLYVVPALTMRIVVVSLVFSALFAACARMVLLAAPVPRPPSYLALAALYGGLALLLAFRSVREFLGAPLADPMDLTPFQALLFTIGAVAPPLATFGFIVMVTERLRGELIRQATLDGLTGTLNRRAVAEQAERGIAQARREGTPYAVLLLDVDRFKRINDTLGHAAGDTALQLLVGVLREGMRGEDVLGRMGGEEFAVLLPHADCAQAQAAAERLRQAVERAQPVLGGRRWPMTVSIGVAALGNDDGFEALLQRADAAMYAAKREGRNRVAACTAGAIKPDAESRPG